MNGLMNYIIGGVAALILLYFAIRNSLNRKKLNVERAYSNIDVYLQQRLDEMGSLLDQLLTILDHESEIYKEVARYRGGVAAAQSSKDPKTTLTTYNSTTGFIAGMHYENYPQLETLRQAYYTATRTTDIETNINSARRIYNNNVRSYNLALQNFPTSFFAAGHIEYPFFEADPEAKNSQKMASSDYLKTKYDVKAEKLRQEVAKQQGNECKTEE